MGKFHNYAEQLNSMVKNRFAALKAAEMAVEKAESALNTSQKSGDRVEKLSAELAVEEAKKKLEVAQNEIVNMNAEIRNARSALLDEVKSECAISPDALDRSVVALLDSGVCSAGEIATLFEKAENSTMKRYIGKYAEKTLETADTRSPDAITLKNVADAAKGYANPELHSAVQKFDFASKVAQRCVANPAMVGFWDALTASALNEM